MLHVVVHNKSHSIYRKALTVSTHPILVYLVAFGFILCKSIFFLPFRQIIHSETMYKKNLHTIRGDHSIEPVNLYLILSLILKNAFLRHQIHYGDILLGPRQISQQRVAL